MYQTRNHRKIADPLNMGVFKIDDFPLFGWNNLRPTTDGLWPLKQYKKDTTRSHIARLYNFTCNIG
jgi:hypothetical protein